MYRGFKKVVSLFLIIIMIFASVGVQAAAEATDSKEYEEAIERLIALGIFSGNENGEFDSESILTREQLAKLIVTLLKLEDLAALSADKSRYPDVAVSRWSNGYINVAVDQGFMNGALDGKFYTEEKINLAALCTALVKVLGYENKDLSGIWPYNYINKANELKLLTDINLKSSDDVARGIAAVVVDRLLDTSVKTNAAATFAEYYDYYNTYIILDNYKTSDSIALNEIVTNKGVYTLSNDEIFLELGKSYKLGDDDGAITAVYGEVGSITQISVEGINSNTVTYKENGKSKTISLPSKAVYYYKGKAVGYESLLGILQTYSSVVFKNNENGTGFEYGVIYDPMYSKPEIAQSFNAVAKKLGDLTLEAGIRITKNGSMIEATEINENDVVYKVGDIWGINSYILVVDNKIEGTLTDILPNKISPKFISINNVKYELSKYMDYGKINSEGSIKVDDNITAILGFDGKIVDIFDTESYIDCIILATPKTLKGLSENEVKTDKGIFELEASYTELEPGKKYKLKIEESAITNVYEELSDTVNISVESSIGTSITYRDGQLKKSINLPSNITYYYNGSVVSYGNISNILQGYSSVVLSKNDSGKGYEYGVIFDPVYSEPQIASANKLGNIEYENGMKITKNGAMININEIQKNDVVYQVGDIWGKNRYILIVDNKVEGEITAILPNKVSPKSVQIGNTKYDLSEHMNFNKINSNGFIKANDSVTALLDIDGKIVDFVLTSSEDNSYFALVLDNFKETSTSIKDFGKEIYYVRLLHTDGSKKTYKFYSNELGYNGELVKYTVLDNKYGDDFETVKLEKVEYLTSKEYTIDKDKRKIDNNYFADNIVVFNLVLTTFGADSNAYAIDWESLPNGTIPAGKVKYINKAGAFEDVNVLLVENILDEDKQQGIVTKVEQKWVQNQGTIYTYTILINGKEYKTSYHLDGMYKGCIVQVRMSSGSILSVESIKTPWVEATAVDAIDTKRIKINGTIYEFRDDIAIYFKDYDGNLTGKGIDDIIAGQKYGRISVYLDKAARYNGKVELIIVSPY